jgi:restriction system protein
LGADNGIDITLLKDKDDGVVEKTVVQCKAWSTKFVGVRYVRELLGSMTATKANMGVFIATSGYTSEAKTFAKDNNITLLTGEDILRMILQLTESLQVKLRDQITAGDYKTPRCPNCGKTLHLKAGKRNSNVNSPFWACPSYPRCKYTMSAKSA